MFTKEFHDFCMAQFFQGTIKNFAMEHGNKRQVYDGTGEQGTPLYDPHVSRQFVSRATLVATGM